MENNPHIKSPEGVRRLLEELWRRHKHGGDKPKNNLYWVDLPPLTEEENPIS